MNAKTIAMVSYITIFGWIIAYLQHKNSTEKSALASFHLGQSMGVFLFSIALNILLVVISLLIPSLGSILSLLGFIPLLLIIFGIIAANNQALSPVPVIGSFFKGKFNF